MADYKITLDYSNAAMCMDQVNKILAEKIHGAVGMAAQATYQQWADRVMKAPGVWQDDKVKYVQSLKWEYTGPFSARVSTDLKLADEIENGRPAYDMKRMLQTSNKVRQGKKGKYLIIPMRHNTPGNTAHAKAMPADIYAAARQLLPSKVTGQTTRVSATGATVPQSIYQWGQRLPPGMAPKLKPHHTTDIYAGMVKMNTSTGKGKSSAYMTFRIMGEWQQGKWIVGAKPGLYIARQLATDIQADIEKVVSDAISD